MKYTISLLLLIFFILSGCFKVNQGTQEQINSSQGTGGILINGEDNVDTIIVELDNLLDDGSYEKFLEKIPNLLIEYTNNIRVLSRIGEYYMGIGEYRSSLEYYLQASNLASDTDVNILLNINHLYKKLGNDDKAKKYLDIVSGLDPENERLNDSLSGNTINSTNSSDMDDLIGILDTMLDDGKIKEFSEKLPELLGKYEDNIRVLKRIGRYYTLLQEYFLALDYYGNANEILSGKDIDTLLDIAHVYQRIGDIEKVQEYLDAALLLDPDNKIAQNFFVGNKENIVGDDELMIVREKILDKDLEGALEEIKNLPSQGQEKQSVQELEADIYLGLGDYDKAEEIYDALNSTEGADKDVLYGLARVDYYEGNISEYKDRIEEISKVQDEGHDDLLNDFLINTVLHDELDKMFDVVSVGQNYEEGRKILDFVTQYILETGHFHNEVEERQITDHFLVLYWNAVLYLKQEEFELAQDYAKRSLEAKIDNEYQYFVLGLILQGQGQVSEAKESYYKALTLNPEFELATQELKDINN